MKKKSKVGRIAEVVYYILLFAMIVFIILTLVFRDQDTNGITVGPYNMFTVLTGSMSPTFNAGSVILTKKTDADKLKAGDILTYRPLDDNTLVTHRIVEVVHDESGYQYITKGDANNVNDMWPVPYQDTVGRVIFWVNGLGTLLLYIRTPAGAAFAVSTALLLALLFFLLGKMKRYLSEAKQEKEEE